MAMPKNRQILVFESSFKLCNHLLKDFLTIAQEAIQKRGVFTIALSGGKTPMEFYIRLATLKEYDIWPKTHIFFADERFVPHSHVDSNCRMVQETLLHDIIIPKENIHQILTDQENLKKCKMAYEKELKTFFKTGVGEFPSFDFILLGVGEDGHTASLFPNQKESTELEELVITASAKNIPYDRVSLSLPVLNHGRNVYILVAGEKKADIMKMIIKEKKVFPASLIHPVGGRVTFLLDKEAAKKISYKDSYQHFNDAISI